MKPVYLRTASDGIGIEGIGALIQYQLFCYGLSRILDCGYLFEGFKNLQHYQYFNITQEKFTGEVNEFFNLPKRSIVGSKTSINDLESLYAHVRNKGDLEPEIVELTLDFLGRALYDNDIVEKMEKGDLLAPLKYRLFLNRHPNYIDPNKFFVAVHIRKYTRTDCDESEKREYFDSKRHQFYLNVISKLKTIVPAAEFHIYSQGDLKDFDFLKDLGNIHFHIEEYPIVSIYHMVHANILVMANSSMSYVAHLLGNPITLARDNFWHPLYSKKKVSTDNNGNFDENLLNQNLKDGGYK